MPSSKNETDHNSTAHAVKDRKSGWLLPVLTIVAGTLLLMVLLLTPYMIRLQQHKKDMQKVFAHIDQARPYFKSVIAGMPAVPYSEHLTPHSHRGFGVYRTGNQLTYILRIRQEPWPPGMSSSDPEPNFLYFLDLKLEYDDAAGHWKPLPITIRDPHPTSPGEGPKTLDDLHNPLVNAFCKSFLEHYDAVSQKALLANPIPPPPLHPHAMYPRNSLPLEHQVFKQLKRLPWFKP